MKPKVRLYTSPSCSQCSTLKSFLEEHNIEFEEVDITFDKSAQEELIKKSGQLTIPVLEIDKEIIIGFDLKRISELLKL